MLDTHSTSTVLAEPASAGEFTQQHRRVRLDSRRFSLRGRIPSPHNQHETKAINLLMTVASGFGDEEQVIAELSASTATPLRNVLWRLMNPNFARYMLVQGITNRETLHWLHVIAALSEVGDEIHNQGRMPSPRNFNDDIAFSSLADLECPIMGEEALEDIALSLRPNANCPWARAMWDFMSPHHARLILELGNPTAGVAQRLMKIAALDKTA